MGMSELSHCVRATCTLVAETMGDVCRVVSVCLVISRTDHVGNTGRQGLNLREVLVPLYIGKRRTDGEGKRMEDGWEGKEREKEKNRDREERQRERGRRKGGRE